jgi:PAS domain S-box-containing protein
MDKVSGIKTRSLAIAPILVQGKVIGVIEAINPITGTFDPDANLVLTGLGNLAGISIHNAQFIERLQVAHQHYRELFAEGIDPGLVTDWDGRITEANRQAALLSGYNLDELRSLSIDQVHEVNWNKTGLEFETLKEAGEATYESDLHRKDGGTTPVEVIARRVKFEETDSARWILRDISARKELDALREDMTAMIYHDLRSPLGNIISSLDMLDGMLPKDESMHSILAIASNSAGRIQRMVSSLLDISRLESGQPIADQNAIDPLALLREALHDVQQAADRRSQKIEAKTPAALPLIWVDVDMIHRVLINLLENASKYSPNETVIRLSAEVEGTFVKISVKDQGPGIAPVDQQRIFDKFTRIGEKTQPSGLGIGLAFCKLAVEGHGGEIRVQSELKKGTTVIITLPIAIRKQAGTLVRRQTGRLSFKEKEG